jgi:hypothetical protein
MQQHEDAHGHTILHPFLRTCKNIGTRALYICRPVLLGVFKTLHCVADFKFKESNKN